jgi:UDP-glucose 6-dehydrogenase
MSSRTPSSSRKARRIDDFLKPDRVVIGVDDRPRDAA